jgi:hypothetical protein
MIENLKCQSQKQSLAIDRPGSLPACVKTKYLPSTAGRCKVELPRLQTNGTKLWRMSVSEIASAWR